MEHIDATPTWAGLLPVLLSAHTCAELPTARRSADEALQHMARLADAAGPLVAALQTLADLGSRDAIEALQAFRLQVAP